MNNTKVDQLLSEINKTPDYYLKRQEDFPTAADYIDYHDLILYLLNDLKLIRKPFDNDIRLRLSRTGIEVIERGGWIKHLEVEKSEAKISLEKDIYDFLSKRWSYRYRLLPILLSGIAVLISALTFRANNIKEDNYQKIKSEIDSLKIQIKEIQKTKIDTKVIQPNG